MTGTWRFAMLTAAFDASGTEHDQVVLIVAGFISSANDWIDFEKLWNARLSKDGITYFHMAEFAASNEQFDGWRKQEERRRALLSDLLDIISTHCYRKFGCAVAIKNWSHLSDANKERFRITAYSLAGAISTATVDSWCRDERICVAPEIVFEDGDIGKGSLMQIASPRKPELLFRPKKNTARKDGIIVPGFVPLQASDFLAYELLLGVKNLESGMPRYPRYALGHFKDIPGEIKWMQPKDLIEFDGMLRAIAALAPGALGAL